MGIADKLAAKAGTDIAKKTIDDLASSAAGHTTGGESSTDKAAKKNKKGKKVCTGFWLTKYC